MRIGKKRKGIEALRVKHPTPSQAIDAIIREEEQNGKQDNKKKQEAVPQPSYPGIYILGEWIESRMHG